MEVIKSLVGKNYDVFLTICDKEDKDEKGEKIEIIHADTGGPERAAIVLGSVVEIITKGNKDSNNIPSTSHIVIPETNSIH